MTCKGKSVSPQILNTFWSKYLKLGRGRISKKSQKTATNGAEQGDNK